MQKPTTSWDLWGNQAEVQIFAELSESQTLDLLGFVNRRWWVLKQVGFEDLSSICTSDPCVP